MIAAISHVINSNVLPVWSEVFDNVTSGENSQQHCSCLHFSASLTNSQAQNNFVSDFCTSLNYCWVVLGVTYGCDENFLIVRPWLSRGRVEEGFFLLKSRISHRFRLKGLCSHHCIVTRLRRFVSPLKLLPETKTSSQTRVTKKKITGIELFFKIAFERLALNEIEDNGTWRWCRLLKLFVYKKRFRYLSRVKRTLYRKAS